MASIKKNGAGWRAQVAILGTRESKTFSTKGEAVSWSAERETGIRREKASGIISRKSCGDAFDRYSREVSTSKKNPRWEQTRLATLGEESIGERRLRDIPLAELSSDMLGKWRDKRINKDQVAGSTVNRDFSLISNVFTIARKEWKWMGASPTTDVRRPGNPAPRDRRISADEIERITLASGFNECNTTLVKQRVGLAFLFAIETGMRAGEICGLCSTDIDGAVAKLNNTKNGTCREVPLSQRARELLSYLPSVVDSKTLFGLSTSSLDANFRKIKTASKIDSLTFHDTRHEAITRLASKLNVLELARMVGHRDLKMLQIYYNESAKNLAEKLG